MKYCPRQWGFIESKHGRDIGKVVQRRFFREDAASIRFSQEFDVCKVFYVGASSEPKTDDFHIGVWEVLTEVECKIIRCRTELPTN